MTSNRDLIKHMTKVLQSPKGLDDDREYLLEELFLEAKCALEAHEWNDDVSAAPRDGARIIAYNERWTSEPLLVVHCDRGVWLSNGHTIKRFTHWRHIYLPEVK